MFYSSFLLFLSPMTALAALHPTSPTNTTAVHPGHAYTVMVRWIDDALPPRVSQLGNMRIRLMLADTIIATLGRNVSAGHYEFKTHIPRGIGPDDSDYAIAFIPPIPFPPVYSSRFTISNLTSAPAAVPLNSNSSTSLSAQPPTTNAHPAKPSRTFSPSGARIGTTENGSHQMRAVGSSSARFRALYVLWPALVGVALAS